MIFNEMNSSISYSAVQESPYELGIGGALMHVYENECNYNALMKAAALSEMRYYNQTGGDLFVQEAGAFSGFLGKVKEFFKKVIEKIKSIAKKFVAKINQYTMKDKEFVKKYEKELVRRNLKDFEFDGYKFPLTKGNVSATGAINGVRSDSDQDAINDIIERNRGNIVGGSAMTESEYRDELKEKLYGDKENMDNISIRNELGIIRDTSKFVKEAEKQEKDIIKEIEDFIKNIDKSIDAANKNANNLQKAGKDSDAKMADDYIKNMNNRITVYKALSNDLTIYFGAYVKALNDRNRQAKAICVKALSYKPTNESATFEEGAYSDIFSGVEIV